MPLTELANGPGDDAPGMPIRFSHSRFRSDAERLESLRRYLDALHERVKARLGPQDIAYLGKIDRTRWVFELTGRGLIHMSLDPVTFTVGVVALWVHKQLTFALGHTILHKTYDRLGVKKKQFRSHTFRWDMPVDEWCWIRCHTKHHAHTNVLHDDPDTRPG